MNQRAPHPEDWPNVGAHSATSVMYAVANGYISLAEAMIEIMANEELSTLRHHCEEINNLVQVRFEQAAQEAM